MNNASTRIGNNISEGVSSSDNNTAQTAQSSVFGFGDGSRTRTRSIPSIQRSASVRTINSEGGWNSENNNNAIPALPLSLEQLDQRLSVVERLLNEESRLASNSFASNGGSLHLSHLGSSSSSNSNNLSATQPLERRRSAFHVNTSNEYNGSAITVAPGEVPGGKRRKTKKQKKQKKTKKRGNKGKRLTKRNRQ